MAKTLYLDCFSGIAGDMFLGALINLGFPTDFLKKQLNLLSIKGLSFSVKSVKRCGIKGSYVAPILPDQPVSLRTLPIINKIIKQSTLSARVKKDSLAVFKLLGQAEAAVHGVALNKVHFHEIGALDTIFDIVSVCLAVDYLKIEQLLTGPVNTGHGLIKISHGSMPIPAPATAKLLSDFMISSSGPKAELTTPTGAALLNYFAKPVPMLPQGLLLKSGFGAGTKTFKNHPNLLRVLLLETPPQNNHLEKDRIILLKTNIDDQSPELVGYLQPLLLKAGALDVAVLPALMKKNRPGYQLEVMCYYENIQPLAHLILKETSSIGLRIEETDRLKLKRTIKTVIVKGHKIRLKLSYQGKTLMSIKPDYEDVKKAAFKTKLPLTQIIEIAKKKLS